MQKKTRKRKQHRLPVKSTVLLFTNGKTETIYFKEFQRSENKSSLLIKPVFTNGEMGSFVTEVKAHIRNPEVYKHFKSADKVFFLFDFDGHSSSEIITTFSELKKIAGEKTRIYFSNFSFELWLLSHAKKVTGYKNQKQLQSELEKIHNIEKGKWGENKTNTLLINKIMLNWKKAIQNCSNFTGDIYQNHKINPWTNVATLFKELDQ